MLDEVGDPAAALTPTHPPCWSTKAENAQNDSSQPEGRIVGKKQPSRGEGSVWTSQVSLLLGEKRGNGGEERKETLTHRRYVGVVSKLRTVKGEREEASSELLTWQHWRER